MKVLDWECKGNLIRLYLGKDNLKDWHGDDYGDAPFEHNAGRVYDEFVKETLDIICHWNVKIYEPSYNYRNSPWCKDDFKERKVPCLIIHLPPNEEDYFENYKALMDNLTKIDDKDFLRIYFGDRKPNICLLIEKSKGFLKEYKKGGTR